MQSRQINPRRNCFLLFLTLMCLFSIFSCVEGKSSSGDSASGTGTLSFHIVYHDDADGSLPSNSAKIDCAGQGIAKIEGKVYDSNDEQLAEGGPWDCDTGQGTISGVPAGSNRTVVLLGRNADGNVIFRGQESSIIVIAKSKNDVGFIECYAFVPNLSAPQNDAVVKQGALVLQWKEVAGATDYKVLVSQSSDMSNPLIEDYPSAVYHTPDGLNPVITYYWQVFAAGIDGNWGAGSQIRSLTVAGRLPDTGQISEYTGTVGEDSEYTINPPAYTKLDASGNVLPDTAGVWAMVRDDITGLTWEVKTDHDDIHNVNDTYTWQGAQDNFITQLNDDKFGGYSDWRLPTIKELYALTHKGEYRTAVHRDYFPIIRYSAESLNIVYWSSTTYANDPGFAWFLDFDDGDIYFSGGNENPVGDKDHQNFVIAVRGRQVDSALVDNDDGTVTDIATGLVWQKAGPTNQDGTARAMTWEDALTYCEELELAEKDDWRLPNINELQSIVDYRSYNPSVDVAFFPDTLSESYWSSTTYALNNTIAWDILFFDGDVFIAPPKLENRYVRAVRGGS